MTNLLKCPARNGGVFFCFRFQVFGALSCTKVGTKLHGDFFDVDGGE